MAGVKDKPPVWETRLSEIVATAFGCDLIFIGNGYERADWLFIGCEPGPEIAQYAFQVMHNQAKAARALHMKKKLKRCRRATKIRRADLFSLAWVIIATEKIQKFARTSRQEEAIKAYRSKYVDEKSLVDLTTTNRNTKKKGKLTARDFEDLL